MTAVVDGAENIHSRSLTYPLKKIWDLTQQMLWPQAQHLKIAQIHNETQKNDS